MNTHWRLPSSYDEVITAERSALPADRQILQFNVPIRVGELQASCSQGAKDGCRETVLTNVVQPSSSHFSFYQSLRLLSSHYCLRRPQYATQAIVLQEQLREVSIPWCSLE